jgi:hypothetical protein
MAVRIAGERMYLWRAVNDEGEVLEMLVQRRRDGQAALRLMLHAPQVFQVVSEYVAGQIAIRGPAGVYRGNDAI